MCTAATYQTRDFYMGRTLDYEFSYGDQITVTPRNYPFSFLHMPSLSHHYAMIGMACVMDDYPLYYEAFNEKGLGIAGLNFVGNAVYFDPKPEKDNIAQFELIPWILGTCASLAEAKESLSRINLMFQEKRSDSCLRVTIDHRPIDRSSSTILRKQRSMKVKRTQSRHIPDHLRQHPESNHNLQVGFPFAQGLHKSLIFQLLGLKQR